MWFTPLQGRTTIFYRNIDLPITDCLKDALVSHEVIFAQTFYEKGTKQKTRVERHKSQVSQALSLQLPHHSIPKLLSFLGQILKDLSSVTTLQYEEYMLLVTIFTKTSVRLPGVKRFIPITSVCLEYV